MRQEPIKIAGAGPAGLTAAINLRKSGIDVSVYEKHDDTGKRFHGDLQGLENWSDETNALDFLAQMGIKVNFDCDPFIKQTITNGKVSRTSHYDSDDPLCYIVRRGTHPNSLDQGLKRQAQDAGVRIHFKETIPLEEADIVATGPISKEIFAVEKGIMFESDYEDTNVSLVNDEVAYRGYAYLLINKGYGCICTVLFDRFQDLDASFEKTRSAFTEMLDLDIRNPKPVAGVGSFSTKNVFQKGKSLYVGEAAGIQDLMWGFGIKTAIQSGHLAARCIIKDRDYPGAAMVTFNDKQRATLVGRFLWELAARGDYRIVVNENVNASAGGRFNVTFFYNFSRLHKLIYPLAVRAMRRRYPNLRV